jgi:hypothetical protein
MWMPLSEMQQHIDDGCNLDKYMDGPDGPHFWDGTCQIKFVPQAYLDRPARTPYTNRLV